ncbi:MAG: hypothetical protein Q4C30_08890 [Bacteroidia bacterium]|nr:hypothetical protein [Bacteroidia bacterium]
MKPLFMILIAVAASLVMESCNLFYQKADKKKSDLWGIIPVAYNDKGAYAMEARYSQWPDPDTLIIYLDGIRYRVSADGKVFNTNGKYKFSLGNEYPIEQLYFYQRHQDLIIFYTDINQSGPGSFVRRINIESGETIWETEIDGFSFSKPLIRGGFAYIGTVGFIGKMKLNTGKFDWKYTNLGKHGRYNHFRDIDFPSSHEVRFVAPRPFTMQSDTIIVRDLTGEIISMN